jgi:hypothetical protein
MLVTDMFRSVDEIRSPRVFRALRAEFIAPERQPHD